MRFAYRATLVDGESKKFRNVRRVVDTEGWLDYARSDPTKLYGNAAELIQDKLLPLAKDESVVDFEYVLFMFYDAVREKNVMVLFEFLMYLWAEHKAGRISSLVWAAALYVCWQAGSRGMMAAIELNAGQVIEMFQAATLENMLEIATTEAFDAKTIYRELPEEFALYRGVSTGIDHLEDGFSWTNAPEEVLRFMTLNCQNKKEIPGSIGALVRKDALLALFRFESEFVVNPRIKKRGVRKEFLRGGELRAFYKNVDVDANTRDVIFQTGYEQERMSRKTFTKNPLQAAVEQV
jgi:hypothetical protein